MNIKQMTIRQLKVALKELPEGGLGVKDIILKHMIEDEIYRRTHGCSA